MQRQQTRAVSPHSLMRRGIYALAGCTGYAPLLMCADVAVDIRAAMEAHKIFHPQHEVARTLQRDACKYALVSCLHVFSL